MKKDIAIIILMLLCLAAGSPAAGAGTHTDARGLAITVPEAPERIVCLAPGITETVYFLGLGDRVAGVTRYSTFPEAARDKPKVGSYVNLNLEMIVSLGPDLVLATMDGNSQAVVEALEKAGITVFTINPRNVHEALETIAILGRVCGAAPEAIAAADELKRRAAHVTAMTRGRPRPRVFAQINLRPIMTVNRDTFLHDLIELAGGRNIFGDEPFTYPRISLEEVVRQGPEVILISSMDRGGRFEEARQGWLKLQQLPAARDNRVHLIDSDLVDRPSPRIIDGLEAAARFLHPEIPWEEP